MLTPASDVTMLHHLDGHPSSPRGQVREEDPISQQESISVTECGCRWDTPSTTCSWTQAGRDASTLLGLLGFWTEFFVSRLTPDLV